MIDIAAEIYRDKVRQAEALLEKFSGKPHQILNEEDSFLIAFAAGEEIEFGAMAEVNGRWLQTMKTKYPMSVFWDGEKFLIHRQARTDSAQK